ncbi:RagB/SusD family nutrient uptake outer membrane protein [Maribellus sp. YY47]|uniref:RagB/SusD family nutrient uptake outer membrane protein n=1 Tax=Maribellus sp. YY47 TaxID=2929486 RepID=UPI002001000A|nr:RagB/SusD family nutrient uptake outer membrane protein [Maribellus sp. YY47]MCK3685432.1 RagB/SusD family nutrient uptake outer membrane protein [Maribellus sp. YY47]
MKKIKYNIAALLIMLTAFSCDYLDVVPDNVATIDDAFVDRASAEKFLASCYGYIPNFGDPWVNAGIGSGDEVWFNEEIVGSSFNSALIARGLQNATNPHLNFWDGQMRGKNMYVGIRDCNIFLEEIDNASDLTDLEKKRWVAEVKFMKAYYHFWLFKSYGPIPIIRENLPIYTDTKDVKVYRAPVDDVVNYIVELIDEASPDLPMRVTSETTELGRITRPIALAMKARVLATAASPLFNGNTDYSSVVDNQGVALFNQSYDANKWQLAADAAKAAIDTALAANHSLVDEYRTKTDISPELERECIIRSIFSDRNSPELLWGSTDFRFTQTYQRMCVPLLIQVTSSNPVSQFYGSTLRMAELFYTKNGVPINEDTSFDYENRYKLRTSVTGEGDFVRTGEQTAILHFDREARFYASIAFDRGNYFLDPTYYTVQTRLGELATKRNQGEFSATGYFVKKLINPNSAINSNTMLAYYEYPFPIIRLADVYLLYAEALNEVKNAPDAEVYEYIDLVRARAGLEGVVDSWAQYSSNPSKPTTKEGMRAIIKQERLIELAFEGQRFWDLRRWKDAEKYMNQPIQGWNISGAGAAFYNVTTIFTPSYSFKDYLWPIREDEIIKNPNLVQNPGW